MMKGAERAFFLLIIPLFDKEEEATCVEESTCLLSFFEFPFVACCLFLLISRLVLLPARKSSQRPILADPCQGQYLRSETESYLRRTMMMPLLTWILSRDRRSFRKLCSPSLFSKSPPISNYFGIAFCANCTKS